MAARALSVWTGSRVAWRVNVHAAAIDLFAFYLPFTIVAISSRACRGSLARPDPLRRARRDGARLRRRRLLPVRDRNIFQNAKLSGQHLRGPVPGQLGLLRPSIYGRFLVVALVATVVLIVRGRSLRAGLPRWRARRPVARAPDLVLPVELRGAARRRLRADRVVLALEVAPRARAVSRRCRPGPRPSPRLHPALRHTRLGAQPRHERAGDPDHAGIRIAEAHPSHGVGLGGFEHAYSKRTGPRREAERVAQHAGDGGRRGRRAGLLLFFWLVGRCFSPPSDGSTTAVTDGRPSRPGSRSLAIFVHSLAYNDFFEDPTTWGLIGLIGARLAERVRAREPRRVGAARARA